MLLVSAGALRPTSVLAADWPAGAFTATHFSDALKAHGSAGSIESRAITFTAPEIAENGAQVTVEVVSEIPDSESISLFVEKNPSPLAASFRFSGGALPQVRVPLKMAESSLVRAVVRSRDGRLWHAQREIRVTIGGCAG